jgi:hypothetical protein
MRVRRSEIDAHQLLPGLPGNDRQLLDEQPSDDDSRMENIVPVGQITSPIVECFQLETRQCRSGLSCVLKL